MPTRARALDRPDLPDFNDFGTDLIAEHSCAVRTAATYAAHARYYTDWLTTNRPGLTLLAATPEDLRGYQPHPDGITGGGNLSGIRSVVPPGVSCPGQGGRRRGPQLMRPVPVAGRR